MRRRYLRNKARGNIVYPGLIAAWSAKGKTNDDEDRAILKDLTGNGHDITLNGFAFSKMSGYGGYNVKHNFTYTSNNKCDKIERLGYKLTFINIKENNNLLFASLNEIYSSIGCKIKVYVKGIPNGGELYFGDNKWIYANKDGIYKGNVAVNNNGNVTIASLNCIGSTISVEFLPEYPDALVFDGVDDYGINDNLLILTDFTFIYKAIPLNDTTSAKGIAFSKRDDTLGEFIIGKKPLGNDYFGFYSFGQSNNVSNYVENITYATANTFNGKKINKGSAKGTNTITIGSLYGKLELANMAFYSAYLFDRSLDKQEIKSFIRKYIDPKYLLSSEIPTPDCYYDFSQGSNDDENRDTIKDYSGNGNDAVAHNFVWNEKGSGYKNGALLFDGVDDYVSLDAFDSGFKTMFMLVKPFSANQMLYDQRAITSEYDYALYNDNNTIAYNSRNINGTYINNKFNNYYAKDVINKKQLIMVKSKLTQMHKPYIACNQTNSNFFANMALYKFLGFKEALTEEQINAIIKKYNLLDGVDEIEVS